MHCSVQALAACSSDVQGRMLLLLLQQLLTQ
jgi:hypothetical protein